MRRRLYARRWSRRRADSVADNNERIAKYIHQTYIHQQRVMKDKFEMVAKTFQGLEEVLAEELRGIGAMNVEPGRRMVSFEGTLETLYKANLCCRTALRILKPFYKFIADDADSLYEMVKEYDWGSILTIDKTFMIDTTAYSDEFNHSQYVTYRVKDGIVDWFRDRYGDDKRPGVRLKDADVMINVHISGERVTLSLDSSGESLHKRGYRVGQTEAPINEVLAAGIILRTGWRGECPFVDPMCGSGTFLIEAALIAANINPGIFRKHFAFENWKDFDAELFDALYNDDSQERFEIPYKIQGSDISPRAIDIARDNIRSAGVSRYIDLQVRPLSQWTEAPANGILVTNPPYGERISTEDMDGLYELIGNKLKHVFTGYHAWIIGYRQEYFDKIHLAPSVKISLLNGSLECELREYIIFEGDYKSYRATGAHIRHEDEDRDARRPLRRQSDYEWRRDASRKGYGGKERRQNRPERYEREDDGTPRNRLEERYRPKVGRFSRGKYARKSYDSKETENKREESDNPLAIRRNENALKSIIGRKPTLTPEKGQPLMRSRKGWRRGDENDNEQPE